MHPFWYCWPPVGSWCEIWLLFWLKLSIIGNQKPQKWYLVKTFIHSPAGDDSPRKSKHWLKLESRYMHRNARVFPHWQNFTKILEKSENSPCLWASFHPLTCHPTQPRWSHLWQKNLYTFEALWKPLSWRKQQFQKKLWDLRCPKIYYSKMCRKS